MAWRARCSGNLVLLAGMSMLGAMRVGAKPMARIPEGYFIPPFPSGGDSAGGQAKIRIPAFHIDAMPVTVGEYLTFLRQHPEWRKSRVKGIFADSAYLRSWKGDLQPSAKNPSAPATQVSWYAAKAYCESEGKRLPSTREWERIAQTVPVGQDSAAYVEQVLEWYGRPASRDAPVGRGSNNAYGVRDLLGKIWEWTSDFNREGPEGLASGDRNNSFFCGGAARSAKPSGVDYATYMRFAMRSSLKPEFSTSSLGFRCAGDIADGK